jgi:aerobic-type carbon monoxide dehydrogenase small subunit (CoxS/CutS family)
MSASVPLAGNPHPSDADIDGAMSGKICPTGLMFAFAKR